MASNVLIRRAGIAAAMMAMLLCGNAEAQPDLTCQDGCGIWRNSAQSLQLDGAICSQAGVNEDFYRLDFNSQKGEFAPSIPNLDGQLRYLFASPQVIFYADDSTVYALERDHFKVIWHMPWKNAMRLPSDSEDAGHFAIWSKTETGSEIHLLRAGTKIEEEMSAELGSEPPIIVEWQQRRLVVVERNKLTFWPRPGIPLPADPNDPGAQQQTPSTWNSTPITEELSPELHEGDYQLDPDGFMLLNRAAKKLSYYRFNSKSWTTARINATASIHALGYGTKYAMAVTIDMNTVRVVARLGQFLQNRFEAKYWKLPAAADNITVIGQDDIAALDGGTDNRVQTIDTTEMTWKRLALVELPSPGRITELANDELITVHPTGNDAIIFWNARTGSRIASIASKRLTEFGPVKSVQTVPGLKRYKLIIGQNSMFMVYDTRDGALSDPLPFEEVPWSKLPAAIDVLSEAMIVHQNKDGHAQWDVYPASDKQKIEHKTLADFKNKSYGELQTPREKWYGYCLSGDDCFRPSTEHPEQNTKTPVVETLDEVVSHSPSAISWILCLLAFLGMIGVMLWRHGFWKKSMLKADISEDEDGLTPTDIFDDKNRRYITDRDNRFFLAPHLFSTPQFRVALSVLLGPAIAIAIAAHIFYDDTALVFWSWVLVMGMPISAITWIATSWNYWNRYYLLRFGCLTEGKWLNCAQTNPSIVYEPIKGKTYELVRGQWQRVDFVPMVLFDPSRPDFAIQYTGVVSHTVVEHGDLSAPPSGACAFDIARLGIVLGALAVTLVSTQILFQAAYPNSLSAWKLDSIARDYPMNNEEMTFTIACLGACSADDEGCFSQCHQRQLRLILEQAGIDMSDDPVKTPAQFLDNYRQEIAQARSIALEQPELSCAERESQIAAISLWPADITTAFWQIYMNLETFEAANLNDIYEGLKADANTFRALCDWDGACAHSSDKCPEPPKCPGRISELKSRICAFDNALRIPDINPNEFDLTDPE